jgi:predicted RNA-binding Zn-ribbon protein involved in translation (DUF1610 family)
MASLFGPSINDVDRLRTTVRSLGTASVPGLAAALSWRERKVERFLAHELSRPGSSITYDPSRRLVRWAGPPTTASAAPPPAPPTFSSPVSLPVERPRVAAAPPALVVGSRVKAVCPSCHVALVDAGTGLLAVCPECGRLARGPPTEPAPRAPATPVPAAPTGSDARPAPLALADRRSQELFAAYVTSKPIPCPKCAVPLRHRGVSQYACPQCGQLVRFPKASELARSPVAPPPPPAPG